MSVFTGRALARIAVYLLLATCSAALEATTPRVDILAVDLNPLIDVAAKSPTRFAVDVPHSASLSTSGEWSTSGDLSTWTYAARIPGAVSMSFHATHALLPQSATLTVTANGVRYVYTADDARSGEIWSRIGRGDSLAFELRVATKDAAQARLDISSLQAGYRGFGAGMGNHRHYDELRIHALGMSPESASCTENWACNTTPANQGPGDSTAALVMRNLGQCSGVLLNNVRGDGTPYMLTARHCQNGSSDGGDPGAAGGISIYWNAVSACGAPMGSIYDPDIPRQYGAGQTVVEQQDAWLIQLTQKPIVDAYYAGWDATGATFVGGFTPHHALGTSRQFIGWFGQAAYITKPVGSFESLHYASTLWGTVNAKGAGGGGASGAGLFDESGHLVGTVVRGDETGSDRAGVCPVPSPPAPSDETATTLSTALSGIFNSTDDPVSTTGTVTLQSVLDPDHTGVLVLDGKKLPISVKVTVLSGMSTGTFIQLRWESSPGATTCTASGGRTGDGWAGALSTTSGSVQITAYDAGDLTYTVTCTDGQQRTGTASATVHWTLSTPSVFLQSGAEAEYGIPFTMGWTSNVTPCTVSGGNAGDGWSGSALPPQGTLTLTETSVGAVTYIVTCGSGARVATSNFLMNVPPPSVNLVQDAVTLRVDQPLYIEVIRHGGPCVKSGGGSGDGWAGSVPADSAHNYFTTAVSEAAPGTYTYTLACGSGANIASAQVTVNFTNAAPAASIQASAASAAVNSDNLTISWDSNVRPCNVYLDAPQSDALGFSTTGAPHGSAFTQAVVIGQYVYRVKCGSGTTTAEASTTVNWTGTPVVTLNGATQAIRGTAFSLSFASNILPCATSGGLAGDGWAGQQFLRTTHDYVPIVEKDAGQATFTVTCGSGTQTATASAIVTIFADGPRLTLTSDKEVQLTGQPVTLTWSSNVSPCNLFSVGGGTASNQDVDPVGSITITGTVPGTYQYRVSCGSGVLSTLDEAYITYSNYAAPTLTANKTQSPLGESVTLTWASADGSACAATGGGQDDGWAGNRPASGSVDVKETYYTGYAFFYITCGPSPQVRVRVQFYRVPAVQLNTSSTTGTVGSQITLSWYASDADGCTADGGSQADGWIGPLATGGNMAIRETASGTYTYSLSCVGFANSSASANVTVTMNAAAPPPPPPPSGGSESSGGGGGAMGPIDIGCCFGIALLAWRRRRLAARQ